MLTPADKVFTRAETIKLYTMFMLEIGYLERGDIDLDSIEFADQMDFFEQELKDNVELLAGELQSQKEYAAQEKADIRSDELSRAEMKEALQEVDKEVAGAKAALDTAKQALAAFKANRRGYLVAYVNNQVHGTPMPPEFTNVAPA
jgi:hypothetical protein